MIKAFTDDAWDDYIYWLQNDKRKLKRINELIRDIERNAFEGIGKPEPLRYELQGWWSRRIDTEHRLIYRVESKTITILSCKDHYL